MNKCQDCQFVKAVELIACGCSRMIDCNVFSLRPCPNGTPFLQYNCHYDPPNHVDGWPEVLADDFCGKFQPREQRLSSDMKLDI